MTRCTVLSLILLSPALAQADAIEFQVVPKVLSGSKDRPHIAITANERVGNVAIKLKRSDGRSFAFNTGKLREGASKKFLLDLPPGEHHFQGTLELTVGKEKQTQPLDFDAEIVGPARLTVDKSKVDLAVHALEIVSSRKTSRIDVEVTSDQGQNLGVTDIPFDRAPAGTPLKVTWKQEEGTVLKIALKVHDPDQFYSGLELFPWQVDIPHEEVNFATGSFTIEKGEEAKLDKSFGLIVDAVSRVGRFADIKLYVSGHTDIVGPTDSNRVLSINRARAISEYFRRRGLRLPIYFEGFGEQALLVATADETDEIKNRRAEYIVAIEEPSIRNSQVTPAWKGLR
jgi:outer membrane protein OmpA-like peptidoglycan-associated protein